MFRQVGETLCRVWREVEEGTISKSRRALFGDDFHETYEILQNRFLFVEGGNDDHMFLEHYVLLGNFMNDPDRFGVFDELLLDFVREFVRLDENAEELSKARKICERLMEQARLLRSELARLEAEQEEAGGRAGGSDSPFPRIFKRKTGSTGIRANSATLRRKSASVEKNLEELAPQIEAARQRMEFLCRGISEPPGRLPQSARERAAAL